MFCFQLFFWGQGNFCQASAIIVQPDADETGQTENDSYTVAVLTNETLESSVATSVRLVVIHLSLNIKQKHTIHRMLFSLKNHA